MKLYNLVLLFVCLSCTAYSQQSTLQIDPAKDQKQFNGFTIQLKQAQGNTVLFNLLKDQKLIYGQPFNPITLNVVGFSCKEDAYKVGEYMIKEYGSQQTFPAKLPSQLALQLGLRTIFQPAHLN
jgi:cell division protein YceG involved in septum cleavage